MWRFAVLKFTNIFHNFFFVTGAIWSRLPSAIELTLGLYSLKRHRHIGIEIPIIKLRGLANDLGL